MSLLSVRGVKAEGGSPGRELSCGVVLGFAVVRSPLFTHRASCASASAVTLATTSVAGW